MNWNGQQQANVIQKTILCTTVGKNPLEEMEELFINQRVWNAVLGCDFKNDSMILIHFQGRPFIITLYIQVYAPTTNAEEAAVEWFYEDLQDFL